MSGGGRGPVRHAQGKRGARDEGHGVGLKIGRQNLDVTAQPEVYREVSARFLKARFCFGQKLAK